MEKIWEDAESTCIYQCFALYHQFCATYKRPQEVRIHELENMEEAVKQIREN